MHCVTHVRARQLLSTYVIYTTGEQDDEQGDGERNESGNRGYHVDH